MINPNNNKDCYYFEDDPHAHGGYECNVTTKTWSNRCKPYYCDIGYYFDKYQNKCIEDICTKGEFEEDNDTEKANDDRKEEHKDNHEQKNKVSIWVLIGILAFLLFSIIAFQGILIKVEERKITKSHSETSNLIAPENKIK